MKKLRIGIIGNGGIAKAVHLPAYQKMDEVEIVATCDILPHRMDEVEKILGHSIKKYQDYKDLIADPNIDAIDICTPNYLHSIIAIQALKANKHVFCEKPDAISVQEVEEMKKTAEQTHKVLMVMRNNRHLATSKYLKKYIEDGKMGEIYCGRCGWQRRRGIPGKGGWFTTKAQSGGGPLIDLGVHMIDLAIYLMGNPKPVAVSGATYTKFANDASQSDSVHASFGDSVENGTFDVEDLAMGFIKFDNGACLQIEFSWASNVKEEKNFVELRGTKGGLSWEPNHYEIYTEEAGQLFDLEPKGTLISNGHAANLQHFVNVVLHDEKPDFVPQQGVEMIKILQAIYQSAQTGKEVEL